MPDYPIALNLAGHLCVVIGAGAVGRRKAAGLLESGARVRLVDPRVETLGGLSGAELRRETFRPEHLQGARLVIAATDDAALNHAVIVAAQAAGALAQAVDDPAGSDFQVPAVLRRGDLTWAVSSAGRSPTLSVLVRDLLASDYGEEWAQVLELAAALRKRRLTVEGARTYNLAVLQDLLSGGLAHLLSSGQYDAVERLLQKTLGEKISLDDLGIPVPKGLK